MNMLTICKKHANMLGINREHAEQVFGTYQQYADHIQYIHRAALPIGVNDAQMGDNTTNGRQKKTGS